jgi:hypothetical protein
LLLSLDRFVQFRDDVIDAALLYLYFVKGQGQSDDCISSVSNHGRCHSSLMIGNHVGGQRLDAVD